MLLQGKTALVTGSTSGVGRGIAKALAAEGANIVLNGFGSPNEIEEAKSEVSVTSGSEVRYYPADMSKPEQITAMVREAESTFGGIDILVNNAGIQHVSPVEDFDDARWDAVIAVNLSSNFHSIKAALPAMRRQGWGRIINIASAHGLVASVQKAAYVASKFGAIGLTKVVALETAGSGVTCNAICPGWVLTPLVIAQFQARAEKSGESFEAEKRALISEKMPSGEPASVEQIGALAVFLCSPAADQITGVPLPVDGGWTAQ